MIIWSGYGFMVPVFAAISLLGVESGLDSLTGNADFYRSHPWAISLALIICALSTYGLDRLLRLKKGKKIVDAKTGNITYVVTGHSLYYIPVKWWPAIFCLLALFPPFAPDAASPDAASAAAGANLATHSAQDIDLRAPKPLRIRFWK